MKTKTSHIKNIVFSRIVVVMTVLLGFVVFSAVTQAYGPQRATFTQNQPATYITFNSITNNAAYGDERNFTVIKEASNTASGGWKDTVTAQDGKEYLVRVLVHNNASENLNLVATGTKIMVSVPNTTGNSIQLDGFVTANNSNPKQIYDSAVLTSDKKFNVTYVAGSAIYYNGIHTNGIKLPDSIVTSAGALVGYQNMDGNIPGCYKYMGVATFKVKVAVPSPNFTVEKKVRVNGSTTWAKEITAKPGDKVDYQIQYINTGTTGQADVIAVDKMPAGVAYMPGTTTVKNVTNPNGNGATVLDGIADKGVNIGNYGPNSNAFVRFTATLPANDQLPACGVNKLVNTATVATQNGEKDDTATVNVTRTCTEEEVKALPTTGPLEVISGLIGVAAITIGVVYYFRSRRQLDDLLVDVQSHPISVQDSHHKPHDLHRHFPKK